MRLTTFLVTGMATLAGVTLPAAADLVLAGGNHTILPASNQTINLLVSGGAPIGGFDLALQVGNVAGGPVVTHIDLESGIFAPDHAPQTDNGSDALRKFFSINTINGTVSGDGLLLTLTLDATGVPHGQYALLLSGIAVPPVGTFSSAFINGDGQLVPATISNGTITVIPEPAIAGLIGLVALPLMRRRR